MRTIYEFIVRVEYDIGEGTTNGYECCAHLERGLECARSEGLLTNDIRGADVCANWVSVGFLQEVQAQS